LRPSDREPPTVSTAKPSGSGSLARLPSHDLCLTRVPDLRIGWRATREKSLTRGTSLIIGSLTDIHARFEAPSLQQRGNLQASRITRCSGRPDRRRSSHPRDSDNRHRATPEVQTNTSRSPSRGESRLTTPVSRQDLFWRGPLAPYISCVRCLLSARRDGSTNCMRCSARRTRVGGSPRSSLLSIAAEMPQDA
jgi:hypothetical protein